MNFRIGQWYSVHLINGLLTLEVNQSKIDGTVEHIRTEIIDVNEQIKEKAIRDALIQLGWTPPKDIE